MKTPRTIFTVLARAAACVVARAAENWKPLWDGKTLDGWHVIGKGEWKIINGAIRGTHAKDEKEFALQVHGGQDCEVWFKDLEIVAE